MLQTIQSDTLAHVLNSVNLNVHPSSLPLSLSFNSQDVIEIQGPPASGKTHLLYSLLIDCIIPNSRESIVLGGWAKAAVVFDLDGSFNPIRFHQLLFARLIHLLPNPHTAQLVAQDSLQRLHIFRPTSSVQLAASILHLPKYHASQLPKVAIGLIAVDSISALYWSDRFTAEHTRVASSFVDREGDPSEVALALHHVLIALSLFRSNHGSMIVLNNWGIYPMPGTTPTLYKQHLHSLLNPFMLAPSVPPGTTGESLSPDYLSRTYHITVSPSHPPQFQNGVPLIKVRSREPNRKRDEEFTGLIRTPKHTPNKFMFYITNNSISPHE